MERLEIPYKFPSLNEYTRANRNNKYDGGRMKKTVENDIGHFINRLPVFKKPIKLHLHWIEGNKRRDLDNIMYAVKFINDAMVKAGKIEDDDADHVTAILSSVGYEKGVWKVILEIEEVEG